MTKNKTLIQFLLIALPLLLAGQVKAEDVAAPQVESKRPAITTTVENNSDNAYATDLKAAEDLLKGISHQRAMNPKQTDKYVAREMQKVVRYNAFSKDMIPHSMDIVKKMKDPEGMMTDGNKMVKEDPKSWEGYDFIASSYFMKRDLDKAIENYKLARKYAPELQKDWYNYMLAGCYRAKKDPEAALKIYDEVISRNENWVAIKNSYFAASLMLIGKDNGRAVTYFENGLILCSEGEKASLARMCVKFSGLEKKPSVCGS